MKTPPSGSNSPRHGPGESPITSQHQFLYNQANFTQSPTNQVQPHCNNPPINENHRNNPSNIQTNRKENPPPNSQVTSQPTEIQPTSLDSDAQVHLITTPTHLHLVTTTSAEQSRQFWTGVQAGRDAAVIYRYLESIGDNRSLALASETLRKRCPRRFLDAALSEFKFVLGEQFNLLIEPSNLRLIKVGALKTQSVGRSDGLGRILKQRRAIERTFLRGRIYRITSRLALPPQQNRYS